MKNYSTLTIACQEQVATITMLPFPHAAGSNIHWELGSAFSDLRGEDSVRVIVLTGSGGNFRIPVPYRTAFSGASLDASEHWHTFTGILRCHQGMAEIEKPIIAKVNGDAIGFGSSLVFACDFIVARDDAMIMDNHMGGTFFGDYSGKREKGGHDFANVPGDGGAALVPLFMSPCKAKEYLMLARPYTGAELARAGVINYAVPAAELDAKVDDMVRRLLERGAYALARTKRLINRKLAGQLNAALDASVGYEMVTMLQPVDIRELG